MHVTYFPAYAKQKVVLFAAALMGLVEKLTMKGRCGEIQAATKVVWIKPCPDWVRGSTWVCPGLTESAPWSYAKPVGEGL